MIEPVIEALPALGRPVDVLGLLQGRDGLFLLESALPLQQTEQFSFLGFDPFLTLRVGPGGRSHVTEGGIETTHEGDGSALLRALLARFRSKPHPRIPFTGGAVGFFSYEWGAAWEGITPRRAPEDSAVELGFYDGALAYEHATQRWWAVAAPVQRRTAHEILQRLRDAVGAAPVRTELRNDAPGFPAVALESRAHYVESVRRARNYIADGDIYQVNLAHRFEAPFQGGAPALYRRLRERSPAPFAAFLTTSYGHVVSCSPELFLRVRGERVETRPIKGTRPRGLSPAEDKRLADELLASGKERAELLMIVDLERNDLGRVCVPGSIRVRDLYRLEEHPTVFHLVATVEGQLRPDVDAVDLLRAAFPGGSITGAPKVRAMQIIRELESHSRHVYTGSLGYLGFDGNCDLNIAIRTIVCRGGIASYHVGAGIVWDSDPDAEYEETLAKGRALGDALGGLRKPASDNSS